MIMTTDLKKNVLQYYSVFADRLAKYSNPEPLNLWQ